MSKLDKIKIPKDFDLAIDKAIDKAIDDKKKIRLRKRKSMIAGLSGILIIGTIVMSSEKTWAYIKNMTKQIEYFLGKKDSKFDKYKFEGGQTIEDNGLIFSLGEVMLDDRQLILSMSIDYSKFKSRFKDINKETLAPLHPTITIDNLVYSGSLVVESEKVIGEKKINILLKASLLSIDADGDGIGDTPCEVLDNIEPNKDYDLNISFDEVDYQNKFKDNPYKEPIVGKWEFNTKINASNILKDTKVYKVNKKVKIDKKVYKGELTIEEVRVSPVSVKIKYNYDLYNEISVERRRDPGLIAKNQDGEELESGNGTGGELKNKKWYIGGEFELEGNEKSITIIPRVYVDGKPKVFEEGIVKIEID
ncbi:DUF4179 domain-containing protein [Clostridium sp. CCUG 7971]|uniref:DUF4179 domain-containing protein n=1 Tax=Clostridium sp. CCUG 7971 TaxID=2811414 RepID=UPI001ABA891E|nr:DUF4179 domain-containing protein [Clostridium sp. CCUG 7971]MBO3446119.1 DUF4179 domain-containing protein [Clostridium sp. CCUG 7971]